ncbi:MAG: helix-turn-helix transcriptional regulator [Chloroflexota bacterium]|nr:helix-turn-helix transcriptional regulator [Chloroflexota bacterium]
MSIEEAMTLRNKIIGVLLRDARLRAGKTLKDCAAVLDCSPGTVSQFELGRRPLSLPQVEVLSYFLDVPLSYFFDGESLPLREDQIAPPFAEIMATRRRMIGVILRQSRLEAGYSQKECADLLGCSTHRISQYEFGQRDVPIPELEALADFLSVTIERFFESMATTVTRHWQTKQEVERFMQLPADLRRFITEPTSVLYLQVAMRLSEASADTLRNIAESLLDITY